MEGGEEGGGGYPFVYNEDSAQQRAASKGRGMEEVVNEGEEAQSRMHRRHKSQHRKRSIVIHVGLPVDELVCPHTPYEAVAATGKVICGTLGTSLLQQHQAKMS